MGVHIGRMRVFGVVVCLALGVVAPATGQQDDGVSDAKVEANVLRALAGAPELSTQNIQSTTVYGVVTLSGTAMDEGSRTKAENLAARAEGVKKVVDELTLGTSAMPQEPATTRGENNTQAPPQVLQSDGTYAPSDTSQGGSHSSPSQQDQRPYPQQQAQPYPQQSSSLPQEGPQYGDNNANPQASYPPSGRQYPERRPMYGGPNAQRGYAEGPTPQGGQLAGRPVVVPVGSMVRIRINQGLSSKHAQPGESFDGVVLNDVTADGAVAIPRGAAVQGTVVSAEDAGHLKGRGELTLQLTRLTMGGQNYALVSDTWKRTGQDKTVRTVDSALGLGALGAIIGGVAGGGSGAAIGAGAGAAAGVASSAASPGGKVIIPPETVLTFHLTQAAAVSTVSEQEMSRLSYAAGPGYGQPVARRRGAYPNPYYAPYPPYYGSRY